MAEPGAESEAEAHQNGRRSETKDWIRALPERGTNYVDRELMADFADITVNQADQWLHDFAEEGLVTDTELGWKVTLREGSEVA